MNGYKETSQEIIDFKIEEIGFTSDRDDAILKIVKPFGYSKIKGKLKIGDNVNVKLNSINDGIKETSDKLIYDIDFDYITGMAERMQLNRDKYPVGNWQKPIDIFSLQQALFRHVMQIMKSDYHDDQLYGHLYAVGCNAFMIIEQLKNNNEKIK